MRTKYFHIEVPDERVVDVVRVDERDFIVVTQRGRTRTTYRGVPDRVRKGDVLARPPRHDTRSVCSNWSPWEGVDDDE